MFVISIALILVEILVWKRRRRSLLWWQSCVCVCTSYKVQLSLNEKKVALNAAILLSLRWINKLLGYPLLVYICTGAGGSFALETFRENLYPETLWNNTRTRTSTRTRTHSATTVFVFVVVGYKLFILRNTENTSQTFSEPQCARVKAAGAGRSFGFCCVLTQCH